MPTPMPDVRGKAFDPIEAQFEANGFTVVSAFDPPGATPGPNQIGMIAAQYPNPGTDLNPGQKVGFLIQYVYMAPDFMTATTTVEEAYLTCQTLVPDPPKLIVFNQNSGGGLIGVPAVYLPGGGGGSNPIEGQDPPPGSPLEEGADMSVVVVIEGDAAVTGGSSKEGK